MDGFVMTPAPSTNRYDNAPFIPIIEEAGGRVSDWK
jgi:fructose-1,6-bisphosphatase/inositol monophosphatase family enzyme